VVINHLNKLDVCRRVIDLDNVERVVSPDVARSRLQPVQVFTIRQAAAGNFFRGEQNGDPPGDSDIGGWSVPFLCAAGADLFNDRCKVRLLRAQPHLPQGHRDDVLDCGVDPWLSCSTPSRQKGRYPALFPIPRQIVVDLACREPQLGCRAHHGLTHRRRSVKNPVQLARGTRRLGPRFIRGMRFAGRHRYETSETGWVMRQQGGHLLKYVAKIEALS